MNINWFPGHMKKAAEEVKETLSLVDIVLEMLDARIPHSSSNPLLDKILGEKRRIKVLTKVDLADEAAVNHFVRLFDAIPINSLTGDGIRRLKDRIADLSSEVNERLKLRGRKPREIRVMVVGIPNVGKSSLINRIAGKNVCKSGNKPGVTRGRQWINIAKGISLCDTAGILWPKFDDMSVGIRLALTGAIRDEILSVEDLALKLLEYEAIKAAAASFYGVEIAESSRPPDADSSPDIDFPPDVDSSPVTDFPPDADSSPDSTHPLTDSSRLLEEIARRRGYLLAGAQVDVLKAARLLIDDFRAGRLGRHSLE